MQITEIKEWLEIYSFVVAIIGGLIGLYFLIRKENKSRMEELYKQFSGKWTNQGAVNGPENTYDLDIELFLKNREISGVLSVINTNTGSRFNCLSIIGKRFRKRARIRFIILHKGELQALGEALLSLNKETIRWKLCHGISDYFPKRTRLWRSVSNSAA